MRIALSIPAVLVALLSVNSALAVIETYQFSSPSLEARYHRLSQELRCPKCQNQNIADSNAPISQDLRALLYKQLERGQSDREILDDMVARYGEFVRYRPDMAGATLWLWLTPVLLLTLGGLFVAVLLRSRAGDNQALSADEQKQVEALLRQRESGQ